MVGPRREWLRLLGWRLGFGVGILVLWEVAAGRWLDPFWFSSPLRILSHLIQWTREGTLFGHLMVTLRETFLGYLLGSVAGILVGVVLSRLEFLAEVLDPFIVAVNGIPRVALAPLFIIWFGIGELSKVVLASTLTFFITFYATFSGLRAVEPAYQEIARVMGASERQIFFKVNLPAASPWIVSALKVGVPFSLIGAIIGEFMAASRGLGYILGSVSGIAVGVVLARLEFVAQVFDPFIVAANGIPRVALAPLFIIWFGIGELSKVILASTLVFFLTFYGTFSGLRAVEPAYKEIARVMGANERQIFAKVSLPAASPWIVAALKVGVPFALIGAIIGEFMAASRGLGYMIQLNTNQFDTTGAVSGIVVLMLSVMLFNGLLNRLERYVLRWRPRERAAQARELQ